MSIVFTFVLYLDSIIHHVCLSKNKRNYSLRNSTTKQWLTSFQKKQVKRILSKTILSYIFEKTVKPISEL